MENNRTNVIDSKSGGAVLFGILSLLSALMFSVLPFEQRVILVLLGVVAVGYGIYTFTQKI